ncbi:MAG TPA: nickel pincer cofactor biosynthesis protein LarC [Cyanobacteria bacterium UBA8530]|nr:nickel pincer cofactor biosynthesis protein LarC [Cyanobacteria bacterium UBA8530]
MKIAHFDCFNGASGDMILGALVHAGADPLEILRALATLPVQGFDVRFEKTERGGISALHAVVETEEGHHHRGLGKIIEIIEGGNLSERVKNRAIQVFKRLAQAEASVHDCAIETIHFHEVGALDAIVDIVGSCQALEELGIEEITFSPLPLGSGTVRCAHGLLPVPAPAVLELVKGFPVFDNGEKGELVTPTGAAILTALGKSNNLSNLVPSSTGYGSGTRADQNLPNLLRVIIGNASERLSEISERLSEALEASKVFLVETNLDDMNPQFFERVMERLFEVGALDVTLVQAGMKNNRPGVILTAVSPPEFKEQCAAVILEETTAIGVRLIFAERRVMERKIETVETAFGPIRVKEASLGAARNRMPEYRDCLEAAKKFEKPVKEVWAAVIAALPVGP